MTIRDRIRELANERGMSLPALESALGFGNGTIVKWDKASPNTDKLAKVANYFCVSLDYLYNGRYECKVTSLANGIIIISSSSDFDLRNKIAEFKEEGGKVVFRNYGTAIVLTENSNASDQTIAEIIASVKNEQPTESDELSPIKKEFIDFVDKLTDEQAALALRALKAFLGEQP